MVGEELASSKVADTTSVAARDRTLRCIAAVCVVTLEIISFRVRYIGLVSPESFERHGHFVC